jgi:hypothetical protein
LLVFSLNASMWIDLFRWDNIHPYCNGPLRIASSGFLMALLKDEVKDGFERLYNLNIERERQECLLDGFALFHWHD